MKRLHALFVMSAVLLSIVPVEAQHQSALSTHTTTGSTEPASGSTEATGATTGAAAADWCAEHEVPESLCTRCNADLIPAFKAKGDWCGEHGLPESFCPVCHPGRGGRRQPVNLSADPAPADGTKVRLADPEIARLVGIETVKAVERPSFASVLAVTRLVPDGSRIAAVNARAAGVVRAVQAEVGSLVTSGATLAVVESTTVGADRSRLVAAKARLDIAASQLASEHRLLRQGIASRKDAQAAEREWAAVRAEYEALQAAVSVVGSPVQGPSTYRVTAPFAGTVTRRNVSLGQLVDTEQAFFEVVDTSSVWAELDLPEAEVGGVSIGQSVIVTFDSLPGREFTGRLTYLAPEIDVRTRTVRGRVPLRNPEGCLRANMFGLARVVVAPMRSSVAVPRSAVQRVSGVAMVFVRLEADRYELRRVNVAGQAFDPYWLELERGVRADESVVTTGSYQLKTETIKTSIGAGCCEVD